MTPGLISREGGVLWLRSIPLWVPCQNNLNTPVGADSLAPCWPHVAAFSTKRSTFIPASPHPINNANFMSGILRKRPPSGGGAPTGPSSCEIAVLLAAFSNPLTTHSQETTVHRCRQAVTGHCEGIFRRVSTPQGVSRGRQRVDQALRCASPSSNPRLN